MRPQTGRTDMWRSADRRPLCFYCGHLAMCIAIANTARVDTPFLPPPIAAVLKTLWVPRIIRRSDQAIRGVFDHALHHPSVMIHPTDEALVTLTAVDPLAQAVETEDGNLRGEFCKQLICSKVQSDAEINEHAE